MGFSARNMWKIGWFIGIYFLLVLNVGNVWEWGNGININSYCGSFPHSLLSTSKILSQYLFEMGFKRETDGVSSKELWIYQGLFGFHRDSRGIDWGFNSIGISSNMTT